MELFLVFIFLVGFTVLFGAIAAVSILVAGNNASTVAYENARTFTYLSLFSLITAFFSGIMLLIVTVS